jgi:Asp-tRNA(Asn)/Glu-tRNA(Gln) amidotransferase C subunit
MAKGIDFFKIGQVSGGAQPDIAGAVSKGLQMGLGILQKLENDRKKADAEIASVINTIGDDYDPSLFQVDSVRNTLTNVLQNSKIEAAKLIQERRGLSPTDERYTELTSQINTIRGSFDRLNKNATSYNDIAKQYAELRRAKQLSTAMGGQMVQDLDAILLKGQFNVKDDGKGNLTYIANGREYTQEQLDDFAMPNYNLATSYAGQIDGIEKYSQSTGKEIKEGDTQYNKLAIGLGNLLNNYTDQELKSAGIDGFINGQPLFLSTPEEKSTLLMLSGADLKAFVQDKLMDNYLNISSEAAKLYKAPEPEISKLTLSEQKRLQILDLYNKSLPQIRPTLTSFLNSNKTAQDAINNFSKLGLNVTDQVQDDDGNIIAITVKHGLVDESTQISLTDPVAAEVGLSNALGYSILGGVYTPQTATEPEQTPADSTVSATEKIPGTLEEGQYPENFANLDTTERLRSSIDTTEMFTKIQSMVVDAGVPSSRKRDFASKIQKELKDFYGNNYSEANINKAIFDVIGRKNYNEKLKTDFEKGAEEQTSLETIQKASTATLTRAELQKLSSRDLNKILKAVNKTQAIDLTEQDILIAAYIQETGDTIENVNTRLASSNLPII